MCEDSVLLSLSGREGGHCFEELWRDPFRMSKWVIVTRDFGVVAEYVYQPLL